MKPEDFVRFVEPDLLELFEARRQNRRAPRVTEAQFFLRGIDDTLGKFKGKGQGAQPTPAGRGRPPVPVKQQAQSPVKQRQQEQQAQEPVARVPSPHLRPPGIPAMTPGPVIDLLTPGPVVDLWPGSPSRRPSPEPPVSDEGNEGKRLRLEQRIQDLDSRMECLSENLRDPLKHKATKTIISKRDRIYDGYAS